MDKSKATQIVIDMLMNVDTTTTRGQLLLMDQFATTLANETERAFRAGLKRGKALAAEQVADAQFVEVDASPATGVEGDVDSIWSGIDADGSEIE
jgi:hypothetical protein